MNSHLHHGLVVVFERPIGFNILVQAPLKSSQRSSQKKQSRTNPSSSETLSGQDSKLTNEVILLCLLFNFDCALIRCLLLML